MRRPCFSYSMFHMKAIVYDSKTDPQWKFVSDYVSKDGQLNRGEVRVKVAAVGLNPVDYKLIDVAVMKWSRDGKPVGMEFSGQITQVGRDVKLKVGDNVFGFGQFSLAESAVALEKNLHLVPSNMDLVEAGGWPIVALTAIQGLRRGGCLNSHKPVKVLIIGASGGVGHLAVQIAKKLNPIDSKVIAITSAKNIEFVKNLGADEIIDYTSNSFDLPKMVQDCDMVLDCVSPVVAYEAHAMQCLKPNGQYIQITPNGLSDFFLDKIKSTIGLNFFRRDYQFFMVEPNQKDLELAASLFERGLIKLHISKIVDFNQSAALALNEIKSHRTVGKIIVKL